MIHDPPDRGNGKTPTPSECVQRPGVSEGPIDVAESVENTIERIRRLHSAVLELKSNLSPDSADEILCDRRFEDAVHKVLSRAADEISAIDGRLRNLRRIQGGLLQMIRLDLGG